MNTDSFINYIKTEGIHVHIVKDVERRFDTPNHELDWPLPKVKPENCYWINERWIRCKSNDRVFCIETKNI